MPLDCGSTMFNTICVAMAASMAVPPFFSTSQPALVASGLAATTMKLRENAVFLLAKPVAISGAPLAPGVPGS